MNGEVETTPARERLRWLILILAIAGVNYFSGRLGLLLALPPGFATAVWPPSGVALGAVLLFGYRAWPGVWLGSFAMNIFIAQQAGPITDWPQASIIAGSIGTGSTLQALVGAWMIRRWVGFPNTLIHERDILLFLLLGGPVSCLIAASVGVSTLVMAGFISSSSVPFQWWTWWIGDTIGVLVVMPLTLIALARPREIWSGRFWTVGAPLMLAFVVAIAFFIYSSRAEQGRLDHEMERQQADLVDALRDDLARKLDFLDAAASLFDVSDHVSRADFHRFSERNLQHLDGVQAISWSPVIPQSQRSIYERAARKDGIASFEFRNFNSNANLMAGERDYYAPVYYIEPASGNEIALGYDLGSDPARRDMLDRARDSGRPAASAPLTFVQENAGQRGVLVARPLYRRQASLATVAQRRENLIGFVVMALRMGDMVTNALAPEDSNGFLVALEDLSASEPNRTLLPSQLLNDSGHSRDELRPGHAWTDNPIEFADRHWSLRLTPTTAAVARQRSLVAWAILIGGMMFTSLLGAFLLNVTGRSIQVHELMEARAQADAHFRLAVEAAPSALILTNQEGLMTLVNAQAEKMFGYERVEMLGKPIEMLVPARYHHAHAGHRKGFFKNPEARAMGVGRDLYGRHKSGSEVPVEVGLNTLRTDEGLFVLASIIDITERKRVNEMMRLAQANVLRESILDSAPFSIIAVDLEGKIISANPASLRLLGYEKNELLEKHAASLIHVESEIEKYAANVSREFGRTVKADHQALTAYAELGLPDEHEWIYLRKDGSQVPVNLSVTALRDDHGLINGFLNIAYDVSERRRNAETILHMAHHDALTELPNRALLMDRVDMAIRQGRRSNRSVAVLMLDLDHFKRVNDSLGHQAGDELLLAVAKRIQNTLRETDTVARLGGDEFVVVLTEVGTREELKETVKRIIHRISAPLTIQNHELMITTSVGGCLFPGDGEDAVTLIKNADTAMYAAKAAGRNNYQWFSPEMQKQTEAKLVMTGAMQHAIDSNQFMLHYQPEVNLKDGALVGFEALIRWQHPQYGNISPDEFIPLAEETGQIMPIGEWVLRTACREIVNIEKETGRRLTLAVNVSPRQFQHKDWIDVVRSAIRESGIRPSQLELEITEGMLMDKPQESALVLHELRDIGTGVVLDDFGTGYSSLSYLSRFPISKIKIDRSFVRDLTQDSTDAAVIDAVIAMAHSLKISVIAEGIETEDQLAYLLRRGCDQGQGFYFSKAVSRAEIPAVLDALSQSAASS